MKNWLSALSKGIDFINEFVGKTVSWLSTVLVVLVCFDVISRRIFSDTSAWVMELEWHFFALLFLFGAGYGLKHNRHVRVDLFYANFSIRDKALVNAIGHLLFLIPWCIVVIWVAVQYASSSYLINEGSPDPGGLPLLYPIKFAIVLGVFLLLLQAISDTIKAFLLLSAPKE